MFEEFIAELTKKAQENNVNVDELIKTYQNHYQLGLEAGLSEEEIVARFGSINEIFGLKQQKTVNHFKLFKVALLHGGDLTFKTSPDDSIHIDIEKNAIDYYNTIISDDELIIEPLQKEIKFFKRVSGDITIYFPETTSFKKVELKSITSDINAKDFGFVCEDFSLSSTSSDCDFIYIKADLAKFATVSGDINIANLFAATCSIATVSGDFKTSRGAISKLNASTVSGDISINGKVEKVKSSSISGDITINNVYEKTSFNDLVEEGFKNFFNK